MNNYIVYSNDHAIILVCLIDTHHILIYFKYLFVNGTAFDFC